MLGVFLLPAFARLGHECQDLLSLCNGMHVYTDQTLIYTLIQRGFREWRLPHLIPAFSMGILWGRVIPETSKLGFQWLPCKVSGIVGSALGPAG